MWVGVQVMKRGVDAAEAQHLQPVSGASDARVERVPSSEHVPPQPPPAPLRRPSLSMQLPSFPSIPEESIPSVDVDLRHSIATATNASNSLSCLSQVSGGSAKAAEAAVAALLPAQAAAGANGSGGVVEVRAQLQDLRHAHARQGAPGAAANLSPRAVSRDALDVLRGMVEDPVARACANALLRAYARSQISETLPRAVALLAVMRRYDSPFRAAQPAAPSPSSCCPHLHEMRWCSRCAYVPYGHACRCGGEAMEYD